MLHPATPGAYHFIVDLAVHIAAVGIVDTINIKTAFFQAVYKKAGAVNTILIAGAVTGIVSLYRKAEFIKAGNYSAARYRIAIAGFYQLKLQRRLVIHRVVPVIQSHP